MRIEKREARAAEIERAAYEILEGQGFSGLSVQAVAKAARASNETLYRWYGDKAGLFEALIRRNSALVAEALEAARGETPLLRLRSIGPVLLTMLLGPRAVALNRAAAADASGALGRALAREGRDTVAPWVIAEMSAAVDAGELSGAAPEVLAETWFSLLIGDLQIRRATGALAEPRPAYIETRAQGALDRLARLYPPRASGRQE